MKYKFILFLLILVIFSCNEHNTKIEYQGNNLTSELKEHSMEIAKEIQAKELPKDIQIEGIPLKILSWTDEEGEHISLISETGEYKSSKFKHEYDGVDYEIFAYHLKKAPKELKFKQIWKVYDYISDCEFDLMIGFHKNSFKVTDLNNDGVKEIWTMYINTCTSDLSPTTTKLIMYEGKTKFAIRGNNKVQTALDEKTNSPVFEGGEFELDKNFEKAPREFKEYAKLVWDENIKNVNFEN